MRHTDGGVVRTSGATADSADCDAGDRRSRWPRCGARGRSGQHCSAAEQPRLRRARRRRGRNEQVARFKATQVRRRLSRPKRLKFHAQHSRPCLTLGHAISALFASPALQVRQLPALVAALGAPAVHSTSVPLRFSLPAPGAGARRDAPCLCHQPAAREGPRRSCNRDSREAGGVHVRARCKYWRKHCALRPESQTSGSCKHPPG